MEQNQFNLVSLQKMFDDLATKSWCASTEVFSPFFCQSLASKCQERIDAQQLLPASIGFGASRTKDEHLRGDFTFWLEASAEPPESDFLTFLNCLQTELNQAFFLNLKRHESHFALYPPGAKYDKHIDNHRGSGARRITFVLYLNEKWQPGHGGELSIYDPQNWDLKIAEIQPTLGTLVLFRSDLFPHQVEKSLQPRLSLTGWLRNDVL